MTDEGKWKIVILMQEHGNPNAVAPRIPCDVRTVKKWWSVYQKHGTTAVPRNRSGKMGTPKKWDSSVKRCLESIVATEDVCFAKEIKECRPSKLRNVPIRTINYILTTELGCSIKKKTRSPQFTDVHKAKRVEFSTQHLNDDISKTIWTDESTFELCLSKGKRRCLPGQEPGPSKEVKYPVKVMVWGAISMCGVFEVHVLDENVNGETYVNTLSKFFSTFPRNAPGVPLSQITFQQDGAKPHTCNIVKSWLASKKITVLDGWPPNSPDLNPIEPIWSWMKEQIRRMVLKDRSDLEAAITEVWGRIPRRVIEGTIKAYPKHLAECILRDGEKTGH